MNQFGDREDRQPIFATVRLDLSTKLSLIAALVWNGNNPDIGEAVAVAFDIYQKADTLAKVVRDRGNREHGVFEKRVALNRAV